MAEVEVVDIGDIFDGRPNRVQSKDDRNVALRPARDIMADNHPDRDRDDRDRADDPERAALIQPSPIACG